MFDNHPGEGCALRFSPVGKQADKAARCLLIDDTQLVFVSDADCIPGNALTVEITPRNGLDPKFTAFVEVTCCQPEKPGFFRVTATIRAIKSD